MGLHAASVVDVPLVERRRPAEVRLLVLKISLCTPVHRFEIGIKPVGLKGVRATEVLAALF